MKNNSDLKEFQNRIGYHFNDEKYLKTALTHSSFANEVKMRKVNDNERLEFLASAEQLLHHRFAAPVAHGVDDQTAEHTGDHAQKNRQRQ